MVRTKTTPVTHINYGVNKQWEDSFNRVEAELEKATKLGAITNQRSRKWITAQRRKWKSHSLTHDQKKMLQTIGFSDDMASVFVFDNEGQKRKSADTRRRSPDTEDTNKSLNNSAPDEAWMGAFDRVRNEVMKNGSLHLVSDKKSRQWINQQRKRWTQKSLSDQERFHLRTVGFTDEVAMSFRFYRGVTRKKRAKVSDSEPAQKKDNRASKRKIVAPTFYGEEFPQGPRRKRRKRTGPKEKQAESTGTKASTKKTLKKTPKTTAPSSVVYDLEIAPGYKPPTTDRIPRTWQDSYERVKKIFDRTGSVDSTKDRRLRAWIRYQKCRLRAVRGNPLTKEQIELLHAIGLTSTADRSEYWLLMYARLRKEKMLDFNRSAMFGIKNDSALVEWVRNQKYRWEGTNGRHPMSIFQKELLLHVGFSVVVAKLDNKISNLTWTTKSSGKNIQAKSATIWMKKYLQGKEMFMQHNQEISNQAELLRWLKDQLEHWNEESRKALICPEQKQLLENIGFTYETDPEMWLQDHASRITDTPPIDLYGFWNFEETEESKNVEGATEGQHPMEYLSQTLEGCDEVLASLDATRRGKRWLPQFSVALRLYQEHGKSVAVFTRKTNRHVFNWLQRQKYRLQQLKPVWLPLTVEEITLLNQIEFERWVENETFQFVFHTERLGLQLGREKKSIVVRKIENDLVVGIIQESDILVAIGGADAGNLSINDVSLMIRRMARPIALQFKRQRKNKEAR